MFLCTHFSKIQTMRKHLFLFFTLASMSLSSLASNIDKDSVNLQEIHRHKSFSLYNINKPDGWDANWFIGGQVGTSMLLGNPLGCGDMFDRTMPSLNAYLGKWVTPTVGVRAMVHGFKLKNSDFEKFSYVAVHADLMYNVANLFHDAYKDIPRWDVSPYLGVGVTYSGLKPGDICACNNESRINHPFTLAYGVQVKYRITERAHITGELGALTTYQSFDGKGSASRLGDHVLSVNAGLSYTIGKVGFSSSRLNIDDDYGKSRYYDRYYGLNGRSSGNSEDNDGYGKNSRYSRNNYSGLNSLHARMNRGARDESLFGKSDSLVTVGIPVYFFFKLNTDELTDDCQLINIDEIARLVKEKNLKIKIVGAADSATGTPEINNALSEARAKRIAKELKNRGVDIDSMKGSIYGGIDTFEPIEANRFTMVRITE